MNVDRTRAYRSPLRAEQARQTRQRILNAAYELFLAEGYAGTTMTAVAAAAEVSQQTVYNTFRTKPALLKSLYDVTLVGDDEPIPLAQRPEVVALYRQEDAQAFLTGYVRLGRVLQDRLGPLLNVILAGAASGDAELVEHLEVVDQERLAGATAVAHRLQELGALGAGISVDEARDVIWTLNSPQVWQLLVHNRAWTPDDHETWTARAMIETLLR